MQAASNTGTCCASMAPIIPESTSPDPAVASQGVALVLTAASTSTDLIAALDLGAVDYLLKPAEPDLVVELMLQAEQRLQRWMKALAGTLSRNRRVDPLAVVGGHDT